MQDLEQVLFHRDDRIPFQKKKKIKQVIECYSNMRIIQQEPLAITSKLFKKRRIIK